MLRRDDIGNVPDMLCYLRMGFSLEYFAGLLCWYSCVSQVEFLVPFDGIGGRGRDFICAIVFRIRDGFLF